MELLASNNRGLSSDRLAYLFADNEMFQKAPENVMIY